MIKSAWSNFHERWSRLKPPLRPNAEVSASIGAAIAEHRERVLLLGVTPELTEIASNTIAVERTGSMLTHVWPGNNATRHAVMGNWLNLPFADTCFSAAIGDGSLSCLQYPSGYLRLYEQLHCVLQPAARIALRLFMTPEPCEAIAAVSEAALTGAIRGFHALKWRLAMAIATEFSDPNMEVQLIHRIFNREFPDRHVLARATGWTREDIGEIDAYEDSSTVLSFPTRQQLCAVIPDFFVNTRFIQTGSYELAERCPLMLMDLRP